MDFSQHLKGEIREHYRTIRNNIAQSDAYCAAESLVKIFNQNFNYLKGKTIAAYVPIDGEINVMPLVHNLFNLGYKIAMPNQNRLLEFEEWGKIIHTTIIPDTVIVPIVAFDNQCNRLGFGSGWYDRIIQRLLPEGKVFIGVAYEEQYCRYIPTESHDKKLDVIITNKCIRIR